MLNIKNLLFNIKPYTINKILNSEDIKLVLSKPNNVNQDYIICENNKEEDVCFYVVSKGITDDNKDALTRYVEKYGKKICIIELSYYKYQKGW